MNARGQGRDVLWVIIEAILAIISVAGLFTIVNRGDAETGPEQSYAVKDLALTREAIETTTNVYYEFDSPALQMVRTEERGFTYDQGTRAVVGSASAPVLSNGFFAATFVTDAFSYVPMVVLPGKFGSGEAIAQKYHIQKMQTVPCPQPTITPTKIGLVPANDASLAFTNAIAATSPLFVPSIGERKALIGNVPEIGKLAQTVDIVVTIDVIVGNDVIVSGSKDGFLGCAVANVLLENGGMGAYVPQFEDTPRVTISVGADVATPANADLVRKVLS